MDAKKIAFQIDKATFELAFAWRERSIPQVTPTLAGSAWNLLGRLVGIKREAQFDTVRSYEQTLSDDIRLSWRYAMNSLSNESYSLVQDLLKQGVQDLEKNLNPYEVDLISRSLKRFTDSVWKQAAKSGHKLRFNQEIYAEPELNSIANAFLLIRSISESGDEGYQVIQFNGQDFYFLKERSADHQLVFRKKTKDEFKSSQQHEKLIIDNSFKRYESIPAIISDIDPKTFPDHIVSIPPAYLDSLDKALNPGYASIGGFKQPSENLSELIDKDSKTIQDRGYTHKKLAEWLNEIIRLRDASQYDPIVEIDGQKIEIVELRTMGSQSSPFGDKVDWSRDYFVVDLRTGKRIQFSGGHPYMIGYYGFFEGNVPQRLPPTDLIDFIEGR